MYVLCLFPYRSLATFREYMYVCDYVCVCRDVWAAGIWQHREAVITTDGGTAHRQDCLPPGLHTVNKLVGMLRIKELECC